MDLTEKISMLNRFKRQIRSAATVSIVLFAAVGVFAANGNVNFGTDGYGFGNGKGDGQGGKTAFVTSKGSSDTFSVLKDSAIVVDILDSYSGGISVTSGSDTLFSYDSGTATSGSLVNWEHGSTVTVDGETFTFENNNSIEGNVYAMGVTQGDEFSVVATAQNSNQYDSANYKRGKQDQIEKKGSTGWYQLTGQSSFSPGSLVFFDKGQAVINIAGAHGGFLESNTVGSPLPAVAMTVLLAVPALLRTRKKRNQK